jgi:hypothetical protein
VIVPQQRSVARLVLLRLAIVACVLAVVGAGVAVRLLVRVPVVRPWTTLCLPVNASSSSDESWSPPGSAYFGNVTLPPCRNGTVVDDVMLPWRYSLGLP